MKKKFNPQLRPDVTPRAFLLWLLYFVSVMVIGFTLILNLI